MQLVNKSFVLPVTGGVDRVLPMIDYSSF
jgi:hypothetical protein